ncbi:Uma2 family endonuclease [Caldichromatium japonicum]|uniref:Uma2 family endonuclease n=1 Tax=Caldichromatium japonicum TaxID=2699430 RepID=A0A6G7VGG3_9GAMM|nr:Uma2 family endonuclease [Caldichromatium japonicum]QIK39000.1 Uma2 family endonuclease [Caldichromatium japonicum]
MNAIELERPIHRFSCKQFHRLTEVGALAKGERVELIDGTPQKMSPMGPQQRGATDCLAMCLTPPVVGRAILSVRGPLVFDEYTEAYPDLRADSYARSHPGPQNLLLLVEIMDHSQHLDLGPKLTRYADAGTARSWVLDLSRHTLYDHRDPDPAASCYRTLRAAQAESLAIQIAGAEIQPAVAECFPG